MDHAFYFDGETVQSTLVFSTTTQAVLNEFDNHVDAMWMPGGSLLMAGLYGGLSVGDPATGTMTAFADGMFNGTIRNPTLSPDGSQIAFELDQQIWVTNIDGSSPQAVISGDRRFRFPAWSPDGRTLAYLGVDGGVSEDRFDQAIYFTHLETGQQYLLDMRPWLTAVHATVMGPMTWH